MKTLVSDSLSTASASSYKRAWDTYSKFANEYLQPHKPIISPAALMLFIAYLKHKDFKPSTISTYVSQVRFCSKLNGLPDPGSDFLVSLSLSGLSKSAPALDARLPITIPVLNKLLSSVSCVFISHYDVLLWRAMLSLAFFAFLRIGEFTVKIASEIPTISFKSIHINPSCLDQGMSVIFSKFKHSTLARPFILQIPLQRDFNLCPVVHVAAYLSVRASAEGAFFVHADGNPIKTSTFRDSLNILLKANSLDPSFYKGHSFRIGGASWAAEKGYSDSQIRILGRWKSDAFKKYIRNLSVVL